jgi:hypothetical protein
VQDDVRDHRSPDPVPGHAVGEAWPRGPGLSRASWRCPSLARRRLRCHVPLLQSRRFPDRGPEGQDAGMRESSTFSSGLVKAQDPDIWADPSLWAVLHRCHVGLRRSPRAFWAWPLAWPSPSGPLGWQRSPGSTARRRRVRAQRGCEAPLRLEGPARTMRGVPVRPLTSHGSWRAWRDADRLVVVLAGAAARYGGDRRRPVTGAAVCGSSPRRRACVRRTRRKLPPTNGETRVNPGRLRRVTPAARPSQLLALVLAAHGQTRRPGAPKVRP